MKKLLIFISIIMITILSGCDLLMPRSTTQRLELEKTRIEITIGERVLISDLSGYDSSKITWVSADISIAIVDEYGWVTGIKEGATTILVSIENGGQASCRVIVKGNATTTTKKQTTTTEATDDNTDYEKILFSDYSSGQEVLKNRETLFRGLTKVNDNYYNNNFSNVFDEPLSEITNKKQIADILDYMAFYHIEEFEIDIKYQTQDFKQDLIDSFWNTYFCPGTVGVKYTDSKIIMLFNEDANKYYKPAQDNYQPGVPYTFYSSLGKRSSSFDDFNYKNNSEGIIDVYNSDQLIYVLEKGYYPNIIENSPAMKIYIKATSILRNIICDDMTERDKALAISSYIASHVYYDFPADELAGCISSSLPNYPDYIASNMVGFYAEGPLFYNQAVCHGFAKAFALLALIEGLDITKVSTPYVDTLNDDGSINLSSIVYTYDDYGNIVGSTFSSHGYNYVRDKEDEKYYICDPTYNYAGEVSLRNFEGGKYNEDTLNITRSFAVFKAFSDWKKVYVDSAIDYFAKENNDKLGNESFNWANSFKMKVGTQVFDLYIESRSELDIFKNNIRTYLSNYSDSMYKNEYCNILSFNVYAQEDMLEYVKDEIDLWGWRGYYGRGDIGYIFIYE